MNVYVAQSTVIRDAQFASRKLIIKDKDFLFLMYQLVQTHEQKPKEREQDAQTPSRWE